MGYKKAVTNVRFPRLARYQHELLPDEEREFLRDRVLKLERELGLRALRLARRPRSYGICPSRPGRSGLSLHRTDRVAMLHTLRGRLSHAEWVLSSSGPARGRRMATLRSFSCPQRREDGPGRARRVICLAPGRCAA